MKHLYNTLILLIISLGGSPSYSQDWVWAVNASGNNQYSNAARRVSVDHQGNAYIVGYYRETFQFGDSTLINPSDYYSKIYLSKVDASGKVKWLKDVDSGQSYDEGIGITLDDFSNCYIIGTANSRIFVSKYDSSGSLQWTNRFNNEYSGYGRGIALDQDENVYVVGEHGNYLGGVFFSKLDNTGKLLWVKNIESTCHTHGCSGSDIAVDALGNSYITGVFECDTLNVGGIKLPYHGSWGDKTFIAKFSPTGQVLWAKSPYAKTGGKPQVVLTEDDEVILAGAFTTYTIDFDGTVLAKREGGNDVSPYLAKFNKQGQLIWAKNGHTWQGIPKDIVTDYEGNTYLAGSSFGNYGGTYMDFHLEKYDQTGQFLWNKEVASGGDEEAYGLGADNQGNCYVVGHSNIKGVYGIGYSNPYTTFLAKLNTESTTHLRPYKPWLRDFFAVCAGQALPKLQAEGQNIAWYENATLDKALHQGPTYSPAITKTDTFYVTQTVDSRQSWARRVIIYMSELQDFSIINSHDTLMAPYSQAYAYQWFYEDSLLKSRTQPYLVADTSGTYKVRVTDGYCTKEKSFAYAVPLAVEERDKMVELTLFPNPTENFFYLRSTSTNWNSYDINIYNQSGVRIITLAGGPFSKGINEQVDVSKLSDGLYLCEVVSAHYRRAFKFVKN